jgi:hypothetical protein
MPLDAVLVGPLQDRLAGDLGPIVTDCASRFAIDANQGVEFPRHSGPRHASIGDQAEVFAAAIVIDRQGEPLCAIGSRTMASELPAGPEPVGKEVQRPALVRAQRDRHRCAAAARPFAATTAAH